MKKLLTGLIAGTVLLAPASAAQQQSFDAWLIELRQEALGKGISAPTLDAALEGLAPIQRVLELDRNQPEQTLSFAEYLRRVVSSSRVEKGRARLAEHRQLLAKIAADYKVQPRFLVALWA